jgi:hypothetical protein
MSHLSTPSSYSCPKCQPIRYFTTAALKKIHMRTSHQVSVILTFKDGNTKTITRDAISHCFVCPCNAYEAQNPNTILKHAMRHDSDYIFVRPISSTPISGMSNIEFMTNNLTDIFTAPGPPTNASPSDRIGIVHSC